MARARVQLATDIVIEHFGDVIGKVAGELALRDRLLLEEIVKYTGLEQTQVNSSLLILIQHNLVSFVEEFELSNRNVVYTYYQANISYMLWRLRFPCYLQVAKQRFEEEGQRMVRSLLEHGRLTQEQIMPKVKTDRTESILAELIRQHFVVRVPEAAGPQPAVDITAQLAAARRAKPGNFEGEDDADFEDSRQSSKSAMSHLSEGFRETKKRKPKNIPAVPQAKRQNGADPPVGRAVEIYWCINPERFHMHFRHEMFIKMAEEKVDVTAGNYLRVMFKLTEPFIFSLNDRDSVSLSTVNIWQELRKEYSNDISQHSVQQYISVLAAEQSMLKKTGESDYSISLLALSEFVQIKVIESIVQQRFGDLSLRIFRLLRMKKQLEQKQVADLALISATKTRKRLYQMLSCGFVQLQEVPRTVDHAPSRTFYLWSVRIDQVRRMVIDEMYVVLRKLRQRLQHEETFSQDLERPRPLGETDLCRVTDKLEHAILQLDHSLMVLNDFGRAE